MRTDLKIAHFLDKTCGQHVKYGVEVHVTQSCHVRQLVQAAIAGGEEASHEDAKEAPEDEEDPDIPSFRGSILTLPTQLVQLGRRYHRIAVRRSLILLRCGRAGVARACRRAVWAVDTDAKDAAAEVRHGQLIESVGTSFGALTHVYL